MTKFTLTLARVLLLVLAAEARPQGDGEIKGPVEDPREPEDLDVVRTISRVAMTTAVTNSNTSAAPANLEATTDTSVNARTSAAVTSQDTTSAPANPQTTAPVVSQDTTTVNQDTTSNQETTNTPGNPATASTSVNAAGGIGVSDGPTTYAASVTDAATSAAQSPSLI